MVVSPFDYVFRLIIVGDSSVGKSSLLKYFTDGMFSEGCDPTIGVEFFGRTIEINDGIKIKLQLWDTAGTEKFRAITTSYYRNSVGAILVYDICNKASFDNISYWMNQVKLHIKNLQPTFVLVGSKVDLASFTGSRAVSLQEAENFANKHKIPHLETSAKTGLNVEKAFQVIAQEVYNRIKSGEYSLQDDWEGLRPGFSAHDRLDINLMEAEPAQSSCC